MPKVVHSMCNITGAGGSASELSSIFYIFYLVDYMAPYGTRQNSSAKLVTVWEGI